jgi:peroxiredoxin
MTETFQARQVTLAAISVDPPDVSAKLAEKLGLRFPLLSDPDRAVIRAWGVEDAENGIAWPAIYVVDRDGKVRWRSLSEDYKIRAAAGEVLAAAAE